LSSVADSPGIPTEFSGLPEVNASFLDAVRGICTVRRQSYNAHLIIHALLVWLLFGIILP
jgi:hypothetical protein